MKQYHEIEGWELVPSPFFVLKGKSKANPEKCGMIKVKISQERGADRWKNVAFQT